MWQFRDHWKVISGMHSRYSTGIPFTIKIHHRAAYIYSPRYRFTVHDRRYTFVQRSSGAAPQL